MIRPSDSFRLPRACEFQIGYTPRTSALMGSYPVPVYCYRPAVAGSPYCADCAELHRRGGYRLQRFGGRL